MIELKTTKAAVALTTQVAEQPASSSLALANNDLDFADEAFQEMLAALFSPADLTAAPEVSVLPTIPKVLDSPTPVTPGEIVVEKVDIATKDICLDVLAGVVAPPNGVAIPSGTDLNSVGLRRKLSQEGPSPTLAAPLPEVAEATETAAASGVVRGPVGVDSESPNWRTLLGTVSLPPVDSSVKNDVIATDKQPNMPTLVATQGALPAAAADFPVLVRKEPVSPRLENTVGTDLWRQELTQRINMMIEKGEQALILRLSPEHLGPLEIRVAVREGDTTLWFGAAQAETRHALELTLPKLREQFAQAGLSLGQSWISNGSPESSPQQRPQTLPGFEDARELPVSATESGNAVLSVGLSLIDTYV